MAFKFLWNSAKQFVKQAGRLRAGNNGDPCCCGGATYKRARFCPGPGGTLANVRMSAADAASFPGAFKLHNGPYCYYFEGDAGTTETLFTASEATAFTNCTDCDSDCGDGTCDGTTSYMLDLSAAVFGILASCGITAAGVPTQLTTITLSHVSGCTYLFQPSGTPNSNPTDFPVLQADGGTIWLIDAQLNVAFDGATGCEIWQLRLNFANADGSNARQIFFRGSPANGGSATANPFYWWYDSTTTTYDSNGWGQDGCTRGLVTSPLVLT